MLSVIRPSVRPYINLSHCLLPFLNPWAKSNCHGTKYSYGKRTVKLINQRTKSLSKGSYLRTMGVCLKYILKNHCTGNANIQIKASMIGIDSKLFKPWAQSILGPTRSSIFNIEISEKMVNCSIYCQDGQLLQRVIKVCEHAHIFCPPHTCIFIIIRKFRLQWPTFGIYNDIAKSIILI